MHEDHPVNKKKNIKFNKTFFLFFLKMNAFETSTFARCNPHTALRMTNLMARYARFIAPQQETKNLD